MFLTLVFKCVDLSRFNLNILFQQRDPGVSAIQRSLQGSALILQHHALTSQLTNWDVECSERLVQLPGRRPPLWLQYEYPLQNTLYEAISDTAQVRPPPIDEDLCRLLAPQEVRSPQSY
eukprot:XP_001705331.1 Hypothetical protein GL50803_90689 [Giardia lamblia ATCC 50803]